MILQALSRLYEQLVLKNIVSEEGWGPAKVSYGLVIGRDGELQQVVPLKISQTRGKKTVLASQMLVVPDQVKRTVGISANFLCDNAAYLLGVDGKGNPERARKCFAAAQALHQELLGSLESDSAQRICKFFQNWRPEQAAAHPEIAPILQDIVAGDNLVFMVDGKYAQQIGELRDVWNEKYFSSSDVPRMQCLVTGEVAPIAILHPSIKGVRDAQSSGASLVSFNLPCAESYGNNKGQGLNAPISQRVAFGYGAALNYLLGDFERVQHFGDTTVVCWAEGGESAYSDLWVTDTNGSDKVSDRDVQSAMADLAQGKEVVWKNTVLDPNNHFYILGLSPNAARLSVRFFYQDHFGAVMENMRAHYERIRMTRPSYDSREQLYLWSLLSETVNQKNRDKKPSPQLAGDMLRAILANGRYPETLFLQTQLRIRAEHDVNRGKAAIIKAYLLKNYPQYYWIKEELDMSQTAVPYRLGRLFSLLENIQETANPGITTTIKDKYFSSVCAMPATIFPLLINLAQKHLRKIKAITPGKAIYCDKQIQDILSELQDGFPTRLTIQEQGLFQIGYYHEKQARYTKKEEK